MFPSDSDLKIRELAKLPSGMNYIDEIVNNQLKLEFDGNTGLILNVQTLDPSTSTVTNKIDLTQNFYIYRSKERGYSSSKPSGAYRFSPIDNETKVTNLNYFNCILIKN